MEQIDLSFFLEPPAKTAAGILKIEALAPLSLVPFQPGAYYRSQAVPTEQMLYGLLENAMGWHFSEKERVEIVKGLQKLAKKRYGKVLDWKESHWLTGALEKSGSNFMSLLSFHLKISTSFLPKVEEYDDYWSQHLRDAGASFVGGSRHYDSELESLINLSKTEDPDEPENPRTKKRPSLIEFGEKAGVHKVFTLEAAENLKKGQVHFKSIRSAFPTYYVSPKRRGYIIPQSPYLFRVETTESLAKIIASALENPAAPLYLGSNDGWVEATWEWL